MAYVLNSKLIKRNIGDFLFIYNFDNGVYCGLDPTSQAIWEELTRGLSVEQIWEKFCAMHPEADPELIKGDITEVFKRLVDKQMLKIEGNNHHAQMQSQVNSTSTPDSKSHHGMDDSPISLGTSFVLKAGLCLTYQCNFRCTHCYVPNDWRGKDQLTFDEWKEVIQDLKELGCIEIMLTGGDVLFRPDFVEIIEYIDSEGFVIGLNTNGALLTPELIDRLEKLNFFRSVSMSLYGLTDETLQEVTQTKTIMDDIYKVIELLKASKLSFELNYIPLRNNFADLEYLDQFIEKTGITPNIDIQPILPKLDHDPTPCDYGLTEQQITSLHERGLVTLAEGGGIEACNTYKRCAVNAKGDVSICELLAGFSVGNVRETRLVDIWRSKDFANLLCTFKMNSQCTECDLVSYCSRCNGNAFLETRDWQGISPTCCEQAELKCKLLKEGA